MSSEILVAEVVDSDVERPSCLGFLLIFFIWCIFCCAGLGGNELLQMFPAGASKPEHTSLVELALKMSRVSAAITSAQITLMCVLATLRRPPQALFRQPGHWLTGLVCLNLLPIPISFIFGMGLEIELNGMKLIDPVKQGLVLTVFAFCTTVAIGVHGLAAIRHHGVWRIGFCLSIACLLVPLISYVFENAYALGVLIPTVTGDSKFQIAYHFLLGVTALVFGFAAVSEWSSVRRDWVHWSGVATTVASGLIQICYGVIAVVVFRS